MRESPKPIILVFIKDGRLRRAIISRLRQESFRVINASSEMEVYSMCMQDWPELVIATSEPPSTASGPEMIDVISLLRGRSYNGYVILFGPFLGGLREVLARQQGSVGFVDESRGLEALLDAVKKCLETVPA